jgi:hypothetical protein
MKKKNLTDREKLDIAMKEFDRISKDPETLRKAEELHKKLTRISWEELNRPFTI